MRIRFWGTRGSIAKAGPATVRFGGNTSCIEARSADGTIVVLDCGTGAHGLGQFLMQNEPHPIRGHILITHTHWDHIQGIPFFAPLFVPGNQWDIYAPRGLGPSLRECLAGQMQYTYFPVTLEALGATIRYHDLVEGEFNINAIRVRTHYLNHPALTLGYRLEADGVSVAYACDHEPHSRQYALGNAGMGQQDRRHVDFIKGADLVVHDAQYTTNEYQQKIGWGHTTVECAVDMCRAAGVRQLALTHHDPLRDDAGVDRICEAAQIPQGQSQRPLAVFAAAEEMVLKLEAPLDMEEEKASPDRSAVAAIEPALYQHQILIGVADDALAAALERAVEADNLPTSRATTAKDVLTLVSAQPFSLIILQDRLAGGATYSTCRAIRGSGTDRARDLPVIIVADAESADGSAAGITDWLIQPFTTEYARARVGAWIMRSTCRWARAAQPAGEQNRIAALNKLQILDSPTEERFDRITRIAAAAFDVPIALVSLVDRNRQWFKSHFGLKTTETPRDQAFCAHAILNRDIMVVRDTLLDPRFADNPLVIGEPRIRFYAGCPLTLPDGSSPGTLCLIDTRPRDLDDVRLGLLKELGRIVEIEMTDVSRSHGLL